MYTTTSWVVIFVGMFGMSLGGAFLGCAVYDIVYDKLVSYFTGSGNV